MKLEPVALNLPNFLVIGAGKCGTSSLNHHLSCHPQIFMSPVKEPQYFAFGDQSRALQGPGDDKLISSVPPDIQSYAALFRDVGNEIAIGEASTATIYEPRACKRVQQTLPHAKLIAILRDPAERAFSDYLHKFRTLLEPNHRFEDALKDESWRIKNGWSYRFHYLQRGFYYRQLKPFFETFDRRQIKIVLLEELASNPKKAFADLYSFLGVDRELCRSDYKAHNVTPHLARWPRLTPWLRSSGRLASWPKHWFMLQAIHTFLFVKPKFAMSLRRQLIEHYRTDVEKLQELIERDLTHWLAPGRE